MGQKPHSAFFGAAQNPIKDFPSSEQVMQVVTYCIVDLLLSFMYKIVFFNVFFFGQQVVLSPPGLEINMELSPISVKSLEHFICVFLLGP